MEGIANGALRFDCGPIDGDAPPTDPREERYQLAGRLADNMWLGEAIRVLEALGDYRDSQALLAELRAMKAYSDDVEERQRAERRRQAQERDRLEAQHRRRKLLIGGIAAVAVALALTFIR